MMRPKFIAVLVLLLLALPVAAVAAEDIQGIVFPDEDLILADLQDIIIARNLRWQAMETSMLRLPPLERKNRMGGEFTPVEAGPPLMAPMILEAPPASFDWRDNGGNYVTNIKEQGCNDCWAFSTIATLESKVKMVKGDPGYFADLSEQQIKCNGGADCNYWNLPGAFDYVMDEGVPYEACFPYVPGMGECDERCGCWDGGSLTKITSYDFYEVTPENRDTVKADLMNKGPAAVWMIVYNDFLAYGGGVYENATPNVAGTHFVELIGWNDAEDCWIAKNSWGTDWGEDTYGKSGERGYFRIKYDNSGFGGNILFITGISGPVDDTAPVADAHGDYTGVEGSPVTLTGTATDTDDDCIITWEWDLDNDGNYESDATSTAGTLSHTWMDDVPALTLHFRAMDSYGVFGTDTAGVTIANEPPDAEAGEDVTEDEGSPVSFSGSFTDPGSDTWTYEWDFGDGSPMVTGTLTPAHTFADNGVYTVTLTVTDDDEGSDTDSLAVTVLNVPPSVEAGGDMTVPEGTEFMSAGSFTDPGSDTWTATVDYGDGSGVQDLALDGKGFTLSHAYCDNGEYTVTVQVEDDDFGVGSDTMTVTVGNADPSVDPINLVQPNPQFILPGQALTFSSSFADPGWCDSWEYAWSFGDGTPDSSGSTVPGPLTADHTYAAPGDYTVELLVTDDDGGAGSVSLAVQVADAAEAKHDLADYIAGLPEEAFRSPAAQRKAALANMFVALDRKLETGAYQGFIQDIRNNVRAKADGTLGGKPADDWITDSLAQQHVCQKIDDITTYVATLKK